MSSNNEDDKESQKAVPLDLARNPVATIRTAENKPPLVMTSQALRGMRVLTTQGVSSSNSTSLGGQTIITTNLVSQAVLKSGKNYSFFNIVMPYN